MENYDNSNKRYSLLKEQLSKIEQQIAQQRSLREELLSSKNQELDGLQQKLSAMLQEEIRLREEGEAKLLRQIEDNASKMRNEIQKETESGNEAVVILQQYLEEEIP